MEPVLQLKLVKQVLVCLPSVPKVIHSTDQSRTGLGGALTGGIVKLLLCEAMMGRPMY